MTVQISVTVWTILCFLAMMLILDRLLFRPLLSFMDARKDKVDKAREERETALRTREEEEKQRGEAVLAEEKRAAQELAAALESARSANTAAAAEQKSEQSKRLTAQREALEQESQAIQRQIEPRMGELAAVFARRLQDWQDREDAPEGDEETAAPHAESSAPVAVTGTPDTI